MKPNQNHAGSLIQNDHLRKIVGRTDKGWKFSDNGLLPKSQHSAFGDFPATHMPKKEPKAAAETCEAPAQGKY